MLWQKGQRYYHKCNLKNLEIVALTLNSLLQVMCSHAHTQSPHKRGRQLVMESGSLLLLQTNRTWNWKEHQRVSNPISLFYRMIIELIPRSVKMVKPGADFYGFFSWILSSGIFSHTVSLILAFIISVNCFGKFQWLNIYSAKEQSQSLYMLYILHILKLHIFYYICR